MDYQALASGYNQLVPFSTHIGLHVKEIVPGTCTVTLPDGPSTINHVASQHAEITYMKIARGDITARGRLEGGSDEILAELDREGRVRFPVAVELSDAGGTVVCEMTVHSYVRKRG